MPLNFGTPMWTISKIPDGSRKRLFRLYESLQLNPWHFEQFRHEPGFFEKNYQGFIVYQISDDMVDITGLGVAPHVQRQGLGKALLHTLIEHHPLKRFFLEVSVHNTGAIAFYEQQGFQKIQLRPLYGHHLGQLSDFFVMCKN
jgi:ribosomal protein S18 acetylase RimI-like enzyme